MTFGDILNTDKNQDTEVDGISFYPQLLNKKSKTRKWSFCHYQDQFMSDYIRFVQTTDYKLYLDGRFYNTRIDPLEENNILESKGSETEELLRVQLKKILNQYPVWGADILTKVK